MGGDEGRGDCWDDVDGEFVVGLIYVVNHRVRRGILRLLGDLDRPLSPVVMARRLDVPLTIVSYHVSILEKYGAAERVREEAVRGATEHFYETLLKENSVIRALLEVTRKVDLNEAE